MHKTMQETYWHKQSEKPLFPDLVWSRPENRQFAGKLLIIGGNLHGFAAPADAYKQALASGIGVARAILPNALQKIVGRVFEAGEFAPSTPSGSFSQQALAELLSLSQWSDGVLIAGDLGRNSETAIALERFTASYHGLCTITKDAADYFTQAPERILKRPDTLLVISMAQLQKLATQSHFKQSFTFGMNLLQLIEALHEFTRLHETYIITKHLDTLFVAVDGMVSTTKTASDRDIWRVTTAATASVWWLQNTSKPFAALTTAMVEKL